MDADLFELLMNEITEGFTSIEDEKGRLKQSKHELSDEDINRIVLAAHDLIEQREIIKERKKVEYFKSFLLFVIGLLWGGGGLLFEPQYADRFVVIAGVAFIFALGIINFFYAVFMKGRPEDLLNQSISK